jgi:hypothetical protein
MMTGDKLSDHRGSSGGGVRIESRESIPATFECSIL